MNITHNASTSNITTSKPTLPNLDIKAVEIYNKATEALVAQKYEKAADLYKKSIRIDPSADAYLNIGTTYKYLDKDTLSVNAFTLAASGKFPILTDPNLRAFAINNLGLMAFVRGDIDLAIKYFDQALELYPSGFNDCLWNKATALLTKVCSGETELWADAWNHYEYRLIKNSVVKVDKMFASISEKIWGGQRDCRVVVAQEQGIGDNIMFSRFIPQLEKQYNIKCDLQVDVSLGSLLALNGISCPTSIDVSSYDYILPLGSICRFVDYIDSSPYIKFDSVKKFSGKLNIGIVWSGSPTHVNDRHRSCPVGFFKFLTQYGELWNLNPSAKNVPKWVNSLELATWQDTAAALNGLDFIVTVDTSVAHLAGAMGRPTFLLQPRKETDFRWGGTSCANSSSLAPNLWYDSVTVIKNPNDWSLCIENLKKELFK